MNNTEIDVNVIQNDKKAVERIPYEVSRAVMKQTEVEDYSGFEGSKETLYHSVKTGAKTFSLKAFIFGLLPILEWLPKYKLREYLPNDIIAGLTLSVLAIPQGMAYSILASLDPVAGLYTAFYPIFPYLILGTSKHVSIGAIAITAIMVTKIVVNYEDPNYGTPDALPEDSYNNYHVVTAVTMVCGIVYLLMYVLRLGIVVTLMSDALVSGFTTGAAIHVVMAQATDLFGTTIGKHLGFFKIMFSAYDIVMELPNSNTITVIMSATCTVFLIACNEIFKPMVAKRTKIPLPSELFAVIVYTAASYYFGLSRYYGVAVVGDIPTGLPAPELPPWRLVYLVAVDSLAVCIVGYSIVVSMGLICAKKDKSYEVDPNQELLAMGASNVVGACFQCIPIACTLSRTIVALQIGGKTQIVSVVSAMVILSLLLWIGPLFEQLPRSILSVIIIVALKGMLWQFRDIGRFYRESRFDAFVWVATFCTVVAIDIDVGLLVGMLLSAVGVYVRGFRTYSCMLGQLEGTDIYVSLKSHSNVSEVPAVRIFRHYGPVNFATCSAVKKELYAVLGVNYKVLKRASQRPLADARQLSNGMRTLVLDLGAVPHMDVRGYRTLVDVQKELKLLDVRVLLADASDLVYDAIRRAVSIGDDEIDIFPTVHDAILFASKKAE